MSSFYPLWLALVAGSVAIMIVLGAAWQLPWSWLRSSRNQHVLLGATVVVLLLWTFRAGISPGLSLHFLGVTSLTLIVGWRLALLALALVGIGTVLTDRETWLDLGVVYLLRAVAPVVVSWLVYRWTYLFLPKHLFIYLFVTVFAAAALASITVTVLVSVLMLALGRYSLDQLAYEFLSFIPLIALPEALLNGFIMTGLIILRPAWVVTYDETLYLNH